MGITGGDMKYCLTKNKENPYTYKGHLRIFSKELNSNELKWHRDRGDRFIKVISGKNWYLQFDNCVPILLLKNKIYKIHSSVYHRLINNSNTDLRIKILTKI